MHYIENYEDTCDENNLNFYIINQISTLAAPFLDTFLYAYFLYYQ